MMLSIFNLYLGLPAQSYVLGIGFAIFLTIFLVDAMVVFQSALDCILTDSAMD